MALDCRDSPCRKVHLAAQTGQSGARYRYVLLSLLILSIPGCSGCQKATTEPAVPIVADEPPPPLPDPPVVVPKPAVEKQTPTADAAPAPNANQTVQAVATGPSRKNRPGVGGGSGNRDGDDQQSATPSENQSQLTATEALAAAKSLQERSARASQRGDFGAAFELSSKAWESVHLFPDDAQCSALASQLELQLDVLGSKANSQFSNASGLSSRRLIDK